MHFIGTVLIFALTLYFWVIVVHVATSWLIAFEVINPRTPQARNLLDLLNKLTDPVYKPLQKYIPSIGGIDITPVIVIFAISILQQSVIPALFFQF
jgi:YggT family protein